VVMVLEQPGDVSEYRRAARECQSHGKVEVIAEITLGCSLRSKGTDCARVQGPGIINWQWHRPGRARLCLYALKASTWNLNFAGHCSARLQWDNLRWHLCPPEGGRYKSGLAFL